MKKLRLYFILILSGFITERHIFSADTELWKIGISLIPYPQQVTVEGDSYVLTERVNIRVEEKASTSDVFAANELSRQLNDQWDIKSFITTTSTDNEIVLTRKRQKSELKPQGYRLYSTAEKIIITGYDEAGLFYGVQTLVQLIQKTNSGIIVRGMKIIDWPDIPMRAIHYDTKHFQEKGEYVKNFIRTLSQYKINTFIWEWEDKFAYQSHPEIGAPGAFTKEEMQEFTRYAQQYHIQIVPLVQGLGHVSFILKHPQNKHLREIPSNNWGFCPLREGTYELMFDLLKEAIEATPGSEYIHIGCDETYVLGKGITCGCRDFMEKEGMYALRQVYINRVAEQMKKWKRIPIAWDGGYDPKEKVLPVKGLMTPGGYDPRLNNADAISRGYQLYYYDPNPGIEHLFLPYFYREYFDKQIESHLEQSYRELTKAALSGDYQGMISTSWNCSGVHNQIWMLRYIMAAEYSWSGKAPDLQEFEDKYFINYYGLNSNDVKRLFILLNKASYYYMNTFERKVWHWGEIGKTNLPDLPRDDIEYDPFWNIRYSEMIKSSREQIPLMDEALRICQINLGLDVKNKYDFELFTGLARLFKHTANTYLVLSEVENAIGRAQQIHFDDHQAACNELLHVSRIIEENLRERDEVFNEIKSTWEKSQFPKGMSTPDKKYVHARDQQRNFANRRPDLSFMIYDEQKLGLEEYLQHLKEYTNWYKTTYLEDN
jgi:hexosaminidase